MVVSLIGKKRSGKDTIAEYLIKDYGFTRYAFADPIREAIKEIFLWSKEDVELRKEDIDPRWGISPRQAMQHLGTEWGQFAVPEKYPKFKNIIGRRLWVKRFIHWYHEQKDCPNIVISDTRFSHEIEEIQNAMEIKDEKKVFIKIVRPSVEQVIDTHESEKHVDELYSDYQIMNSTSIDNLYCAIDKIMEKEMNK